MRIFLIVAMLAVLWMLPGCAEGDAAASNSGAAANLRLGRAF